MNERLGTIITQRPLATFLIILGISALMMTINVNPGLFGLEKKDKESENSFLPDNDVVKANDKISDEYGVQAEYLQIIVEGKQRNVLTKEGLIDILRVEKQIAENEKVQAILFPQPGNISSISSVVALTYLEKQRAGYQEMLDALESDDFTDEVIEQILGNSTMAPVAARFLSKEFITVLNDTGEVRAKASMILVMLNATIYDDVEDETEDNKILVADEEIIGIIESSEFSGVERMGLIEGEYIGEEIREESGEVMATLLQIAFLLIVVILVLTYRSVFDTIISLLCLVMAITWMSGIGILLGLSFTGMYNAVPIILIGLGIDYAIHLILRYREGRTHDGKSVQGAMVLTIGTVGASIFLATITTGISFASNGVSEIRPMREFGIFALVGIFSAFTIMVTFIPASKMLYHTHVEQWIRKRTETLLARFRMNSHKDLPGLPKADAKSSPFGSDSPGGFTNEERSARKISTERHLARFLAKGAVAAEHHTYPVIAVVIFVTLASTYLALQLETEWSFTDFLPEDAQVSKDIVYLTENFDFGTEEADILIQGNVDDPEVLRAMNETEMRILDDPDVNKGDPITSILGIMRDVATGDGELPMNESFSSMYAERDTDRDGIPDENISELYDFLLDNRTLAPTIISVLHYYETENGTRVYDGTVIRVGVNSQIGGRIDEIYEDINNDIRPLEELEGKRNEQGEVMIQKVTATGGPIMGHVIIDSIERSGIQSLILTVSVAGIMLTIVFYVRDRSYLLGAITVIPVVLVIAWVFAAMHLMGMSLNVMTIMISSLTIGIGVDYAIHITHRFVEDLKEFDSIDDACRSTVINTGTALFGAAMTTIGGFGILYFAPIPPLQIFGSIAALSILFSFISSVFVLPTFLNLWARSMKRKHPEFFEHHTS